VSAVIDVAAVDDHPIVLDAVAGWVMAAESGIRVVAVAATVDALLAGPGEVGLAHVDQLLRGPEVPFDGCHALVMRDVEVVVEVAAVRGIPREVPAHPPQERLDLADRRP